MANLYELTEDYQNILDLLESAEDESVIELLKQTIEGLNEDIKDKVDNIVRVIRTLESDSEAIKNEEKRLAERRKAIDKRKENLSKYLFEFAQNCEGKKIKGNVFEIAIRKNPVKVVIEDDSKIPTQFVTKTINYSVDKKSLKDYLKDNHVEGCLLVQDESLRIK